ncbi:MAG TPA: hypothetical protein PKC42_03865 [Candidatus Nanoperiomorbaceae bacterium]|nr:hypothetical protein [Candidatus Nanoperiomorbaceae bacterium]
MAQETAKTRRSLIYQTLVALAFLCVSLLWAVYRHIGLLDFLDRLAYSLAGVAIAAAAAWGIWLLTERDPEIPEEFQSKASREIRKQGYFARGFVLHLTVFPKKLAFEISTLVVPVTVPAQCKIFGVSNIDHWKGRIGMDYWKLGTGEPVSDPGKNRDRTVLTKDLEAMTYVYVFDFDDDPGIIEDDHVFTFFCDSVRIEALLSDGRHLEVWKGEEVLRVTHQQATYPKFTKWVCIAPGPWAPSDRFHWKIGKKAPGLLAT